MELVTTKPIYPSKCAITGRLGEQGEAFLDTKIDLLAPAYAERIRVYISKHGADKIAPFFGLVTSVEHDAMVQALNAANEQLAAQEKELEELREFRSTVRLMEDQGYKPRKRGPRSDRGTTKPRKESQAA